MSQAGLDTSSETRERFQRFYRLRDRYAYAVYLQRELGLKLVLGFSLGISLFLLGQGMDLSRAPGEAPDWRAQIDITYVGLALTLLTAVLGFIRAWVGLLSFFLSFEFMVLLYVPEVALLASGLVLGTFLIWFLVRPDRGAMAALLLIPALEMRFGLGGLAPLGFACFYRLGKAAWFAVTVFIWLFALGLWRGELPRFAIENSILYPTEWWLDLTQVGQGPWSLEVLQANGRLVERLQDLLIGSGLLLQPFLIITALAFGVLAIVRTRRQPVHYKDRIALEYLSKEGEQIEQPSDWELFKQPTGVLMGVGVWIGCQFIFSLFFSDNYTNRLILTDLLAAALVILVVVSNYQGDPNMPIEYARDEYLAPNKDSSSLPSGSSFRIPTPSEMRLQYPSQPPSSTGRKRDPSHLRLETWRDRVDLDWEGTLPDGSKVRVGKDANREGTPLAPASTDSFSVGRTIDGQYKINEILMGGMGIVYIVTDDFSGVTYAVKTLRDDLRTNEEAVARFTSESKTWIRLGHHPNIVQAMFYRVVQNRPLLFLEYVDGTDLEEIFARPGPRPPLGKFVEWGIQICEGMHYAGQKDLGGGQIGLVHRDIKPGNLMLTKESRIKITDFGLAKAADAPTNLTREKVGLGTLKYMAPEQVKDAKHVDRRADLYALGTVLYEGLVGHPPFTDEDSVALYMSVLSKDPPRLGNLLPHLPEEMDHIVMRCLQKDLDQRYSSFEELGWALKRFRDRMTGGGDSPHLQVVS